MITFFRRFFGSPDSNKLSAAVTLEHVELSNEHLVLGLKIIWFNPTYQPIPIKEIQVRVYLKKGGNEPLRFYPLERFERVFTQLALKKSSVRAFTLGSRQTHIQQIRFISQKVFDIPSGKYRAEIRLKDLQDLSYVNKVNIQVLSELKYRRSEAWV